MSGSAPQESVVVTLRPHSRALLWPTMSLAVIVAALCYMLGVVSEPWHIQAALITAAVLTVLAWLIPFCRWLSQRYTITTRRTVVRSGVIIRSRQELLHSRAQGVTLRQSILQRIFRTGHVVVTVGQSSAVVLRDVPSARLVTEVLHELIEKAPPPS
ncbi:MAG: PH domain-containing protein [Rhodoglobus sp.]